MADEVRVIGRYALHREIAAGGMAKVHLGRLVGPVGFARTVAIKRLHSHYASDPEFVAMFLDEARVAARIRHPNVVPILDVVALQGEIFLVMEYVRGESLSRLLYVAAKSDQAIAPGIVATVMVGALEGLHAAHEAKNERGDPLQIVHRDVSPANIIVGDDGVPRVLDFGIAKASGRIQTTRDGQLKGKLAYMAPEQIEDIQIDRRADIWAASVVLWEMLTRRRLFQADNHLAIMRNIVEQKIQLPSRVGALTTAFDAIVLRGLQRDPNARYATAREMAMEIEAATRAATARVVGAWVEETAGDALLDRASMVKELESSASVERPVRPSLTLRGRIADALGADAAPAVLPPFNNQTAELPQATPSALASQFVHTAELPLASAPPVHGSLPSPPSQPPEFFAVTPRYVSPSGPFASPTTARRKRPPRRLSRVALGFASGVVIAFVAWIVMRELGPWTTPATTATDAPDAALPVAPPFSPLAPPPETAALPPQTLTPTTPAPPPATASVASPRPSAGKRGRPNPACNPPYVVGPAPDFIKHPKPECFAN